jgi:AhpD family alkylhydroperoxidase
MKFESGEERFMQARLNPYGTDVGPEVREVHGLRGKRRGRRAAALGNSELMKIRASQINGCGARLDMHTKEAARGRDIASAQPRRGLAGDDGIHRRGAGRAGTH